MLQIITGKFYGVGKINHNDCKGVLYSNVSCHSIKPIIMGNLEISSVDWTSGMPTYVISYDNQIESVGKTMILIKVGDNVIIEQLKYILSFAMDAIFDESEVIVSDLCKVGDRCSPYPSNFVSKTFSKERSFSEGEWENGIDFYKRMMGLGRADYNVLIKCLAAYNASFKVFHEDISLSYSILVYVLETLSANYDGYEPKWEDYGQDKKDELDKELEKIDINIANNIRLLLLRDAHLKLTKRFCDFVFQYIDISFYKSDDKKRATESEVEQAIKKAYVLRSKYAHELQPIRKQLLDEGMSKDTDIFEWNHEVYFTYGGLLRLVRTVIINFLYSREIVEKQTYPWYDELPGMMEIQMHPKYWFGNNSDENFKSINKNFETLLSCIVNDREVSDVNKIVENYIKHIKNLKEDQRYVAYTFSWIYVNCVNGNKDEVFVAWAKSELDKNKDLSAQCNIATIVGLIFGMPTADFELSEIVECVELYEKRKYKKNGIKLPHQIEVYLYRYIASMYKTEIPSKAICWYEKAYKTAANDPEIQKDIKEELVNLGGEKYSML